MKKTISTSTLTYAVGCFGEFSRRKSKHLTSTLTWFFLACLFLTLTSTLTYASTIGKITAVEGNVDIMKPGQERVVPVRLLEPVSEGDIVRTKSSGKAEITFDDESIIRIAPNSRLQITEYLMEGSKRKSGIMNLFRGKIRAVVAKSRRFIGVAFGEGERFEVRTPMAVAGVKGTDFFVFHQMDITGVVVLDGWVDTFNASIPDYIVRVSTGYATIITRDNPPQKPRPTNKVEKVRHMKDTDPAEKFMPDILITTAMFTGGNEVFGYEEPEGTAPPADTGGFAKVVEIPSTESHPELLADTIPPTAYITPLAAYPLSAGLTTIDMNFGSNESATYSYTMTYPDTTTLSGTGSALSFTTAQEGLYTLDVQATDAAGNTSSPATSLSFDLSRYSLSGTAVLTSSGVPDTGTAIGEIAGVLNQNWGGYDITLSGTWWESGSSTYTLIAGGTSTDATTTNNGGYWLETITNAVNSGGTFSGTSNLKYLSYDRLGIGTGTVNGNYSGAWSATDSGTYSETPLAWSGQIDYNFEDSGLYINSVDGIVPVGDTYNLGKNLVGGTQFPWSGTTSLTMMGQYGGPLSTNIGPFMWNAPIYSWDVNTGQYLTYDNGAFWGINGGIWRDVDGYSTTTNDRTIEASLYSLYIDPSGNAGILKGSLDGAYYPELLMFSADGTWTPTILATGFTPSTLGSLTYSYDFTWSTFGLAGTGSFTAGGSISEGQTQGLKYSMPGTLPGEGWGIWQALTAGGYLGNTSDTWNFSFTNVGFLGTDIVGTQTDGTQWSNGAIYGTTYAYGANITTTPMTWISVGETIGTFDPTTWQAVQTGAWLETTKFLTMAGKIGSTPDTAALAALNIPFAEVGRTDLTGSNGIDMSATMNNVIFFAYNTGDAPKIWATNEVTGGYTCSACSLAPIALSSAEGLSATMAIQQWDTTNNKWTATVNGSGTYTGTGTMNGSTVQFNGVAAGTNTGIGPGTFNGTAAGTAQ